MTLDEVRKKYLDFFEKREHAVIKSASLLPKDDPTTLFTSSGMQPLLPYFLGRKHPKGVRLANSQKCFRAEDIEEIGDNRHTTFFEMLGNFSFGDYFKQEQLQWLFEFLTDEIGLDPNKLYVTVFAGDEKNGIPKDTESAEIWTKLFAEKGIEAKSDERIFYYDAEYNWWSRSGSPENMPVGEPGGPDTEVFYDFGTAHDKNFGEHCHPNCECGRFLEIGNSVFMEYIKQEDDSFDHLPAKNVDFGGGLERITAATNDDNDIFNIDTISSIIKKIEEVSGKSYSEYKKEFRIITDHIRAAEFIIAEGVTASNTEQGYVLRRLIRRAVRYADKLGIKLSDIADGNKEIDNEEEKFRKTLERGSIELEKHLPIVRKFEDGEDVPKHEIISGEVLFKMFTVYGFPSELTLERFDELRVKEGLEPLKQERKTELLKEHVELMKKHQELSRAGAEQKFKGGLADTGEQSTKYHTATHLLLQALKDILGGDVAQKGSNITSERLRFDFSYGEKLTDEQKQKVVELVNQKIKEALEVTCEETNGRRVYTIGNEEEKYSVEPCGGPHVKNTSELGHFKIKKEESVSAGVRRIKAVLE